MWRMEEFWGRKGLERLHAGKSWETGPCHVSQGQVVSQGASDLGHSRLRSVDCRRLLRFRYSKGRPCRDQMWTRARDERTTLAVDSGVVLTSGLCAHSNPSPHCFPQEGAALLPHQAVTPCVGSHGRP